MQAFSRMLPAVGAKKNAEAAAPRLNAKQAFELERLKLQNHGKKLDGWFSLFRDAVRILPPLALCYFFYLSVRVLAGQTTNFNGMINALVDLRGTEAVALLFGGLAYGGYRRRKKLQEQTTSQLAAEKADLEKRIDPGRTSSQLEETGMPRKEDRE